MPKIGNFVSASESPCERCNSKRKVSRVWSEKVQNSYGYMIIEHKQIVCTNKSCQNAFDKGIEAETRKRVKMQEAKMENAAKIEAEKKRSLRLKTLSSQVKK